MANDFYDKDSLASYLMWENQINDSKQLRRRFPPVILTHKGGMHCKGYYDYCDACGTKVFAGFGDFSQPIAERFIPCPISNAPGHGVWASAINFMCN
jgi:hypothetical protein